MSKIIQCPNCKSTNWESIGGLEDAGGGSLREDYQCLDCKHIFTTDDLQNKSCYNN